MHERVIPDETYRLPEQLELPLHDGKTTEALQQGLSRRQALKGVLYWSAAAVLGTGAVAAGYAGVKLYNERGQAENVQGASTQPTDKRITILNELTI